MRVLSWLALALGWSIGLTAGAARGDEQLDREAQGILREYCSRCHGGAERAGDASLIMLDRDALIAPAKPGKLPFVTPGKPELSAIWLRIKDEQGNQMPPDDAAQLSSRQRTIIHDWIQSGAKFPSLAERQPIDIGTQIVLMRDYLRQANPTDRKFIRFFTLTHLHNNYRRVDARTLTLARAALSKALNSLTWKKEIVHPQPVDPQATIYAIDLRDLDGDIHRHWEVLLRRYPYGIRYNSNPELDFAGDAEELYRLAECDLPHLRADWFAAQATQPPLYHTLLGLPDTAAALESRLKVDVQRDFLENRMARAGFVQSGVSSQNRLADRHSQIHGSYWKSYDFAPNQANGNLLTKPLGPDFAENPHRELAFAHDGGEIIFSLPNGLQGYLLVDKQGKRLEEAAPPAIVADRLRTAGTIEVVNGLSCMGCHRHGMVRFQDALRQGTAIQGQPLAKLRALTPTKDKMDQLLQQDEDRFLKAAKAAMQPYLQGTEFAELPIRDLPEPIGELARLYHKDLTSDDVAAELAIDLDEFPIYLKANPRLRDMGLGVLRHGGAIKRTSWEPIEQSFLSLLQQVMLELRLGSAYRPF